jgi:zinc-ribbon domain
MTTNAKFCSRCGAPLGENAEFCVKCGAITNLTVTMAPDHKRHPVHWLAVGLIVILVGVLFLLSQSTAMPTQTWLAYSVAGLGVVLVISGLVSYLGGLPPRREIHPSMPKSTEPSRKTRFSGQLGIGHSTLTGKKMLLEFDPSVPYQTALRDFALECTSNKEKVLVLTPHGSVLEQALSGDEHVKTIHLTHDLMISSILDDHQERPLNMVYDSLTDLMLSTDPRTAYKFTLNALEQLSDTKITAIFLLNPSAHEPKDACSLRGLFSNQIIYGKEGMSHAKFS